MRLGVVVVVVVVVVVGAAAAASSSSIFKVNESSCDILGAGPNNNNFLIF